MLKKSAPVKNTGGEGYNFADNIAARLMIHMLARDFPLEVEAGYPVRLDWEAKDLGWHIDDLVVRLTTAQGSHVQCAISIKSNAHLNSNGFSSEFVHAAWAHWRSAANHPFDRQRDLVAVAVGALAHMVKIAWDGIRAQGHSDPARLAVRLTPQGQSSQLQRQIFESILTGNPALLPPPPAEEAAALLARIRVIEWNSASEGEAVQRCAALTEANSPAAGLDLWKRLQGIAKGKRPGGTITLPELIETLWPHVVLRDYPNHEAAWRTIERLSEGNRAAVHQVVGSNVHFSFQEQLTDLEKKLVANPIVVLRGDSGTGKSSLVATFVGQPGRYRRVVWLRERQVDFPSQHELAEYFHLQDWLPNLIQLSTANPSVLVIDGFEHFEGDALARILQLVTAISCGAISQWHLIVTCQPLAWSTYHTHLVKAHSGSPMVIPFNGPSFQQIWDAFHRSSEIARVLMRNDLRPVLSNLAVLNEVVWAIKSQPLDETQPWIGETQVIDWIWNYWIKSDHKRYLRSHLLKTVGELEGNRIAAAIKIADLPSDQLEAFGEAERDGRLKVADSVVQFAHDIMGDWARYRSLKDLDDQSACDRIRDFAMMPRWGRAIRLYAQSLAELSADLSRWNEALDRLEGTHVNSAVASDLFTDSLVLATNSVVLLTELWPSLIAQDGKLLRRILKRLQSTATVPHPAADQLEDPELRESAAIYWRIPNPVYWTGILHVMRSHADNVAKVALTDAAASCVLYLRSLPAGFPGREDAARLAIELAREAQCRLAEWRFHSPYGCKEVYEALLYSAQEFPDEAGQIALELCHRRPEPNYAIQREVEANERRERAEQDYRAAHPEEEQKREVVPVPGMMIRYASPLPPPWPDGPSERVGEAFASAVLDTQAFDALIMQRPKVASEILLAVCVEEPIEEDRRHYTILDADGYGIVQSKNAYPSMHFKGAFLHFVRLSPTEALETIVRLVNFATQQWLRLRGVRPEATVPRGLSWEFEIHGKAVRWFGDAQVFQWHRYVHAKGSVVGSSLMALEKWLYERIDKQEDIVGPVEFLYDRSNSVAFAGVLTAVGMYQPSLFNDLLRPMLSSAELQLSYSDIRKSEAQGTWGLSMISWADKGKEIYQQVLEWHQMPHRKTDLANTVRELMLHSPSMMAYMDAQAKRWRARWAAQIADPQKDTTNLECVLAQFDAENYVKGEEGALVFQPPSELVSRVQATIPRASFEKLLMEMRALARQVLSGQRSFPPNLLQGFFESLQAIVASTIDSDVVRGYRDDAISGGIAILLVKHCDWLAAHPEAEIWCVDTLRNLKLVTDRSDPLPSLMASTERDAEAYRAEAALILLETREEEWIQRIVLDGLAGFHYQSTALVMSQAYERRLGLGSTFDDLLSLLHIWAAIRHAFHYLHGPHQWKELERYRALLLSRWRSGNLRRRPVTIARAELLGSRLTEGVARRKENRAVREHMREYRKEARQKERKIDLLDTYLDLAVLKSGYSFLGRIGIPVPEEEGTLLHFFQPLFDMHLGRVPVIEAGQEDWELERSHSDFDYWIMELAAGFTIRSSTEEIARGFYAPILNLGAAAYHWVESFFHGWFQHGLRLSSTQEQFAARWSAMINYTLASTNWQREQSRLYFYLDSLANELLGITGRPKMRAGEEEFIRPVELIRPMIEKWCVVWLKAPRCMAHFAYFLSTPAGRSLLEWGTIRIAGQLEQHSEWDWKKDNLTDGLTMGVAACAKYIPPQRFDENPSLNSAFNWILGRLEALHLAEAIQLRERMRQK